jgi:hypothetical protein
VGALRELHDLELPLEQRGLAEVLREIADYAESKGVSALFVTATLRGDNTVAVTILARGQGMWGMLAAAAEFIREEDKKRCQPPDA